MSIFSDHAAGALDDWEFRQCCNHLNMEGNDWLRPRFYQAEWIEFSDDDGDWIQCNKCEDFFEDPEDGVRPGRCPNCGRRMRP